MIREDKKRDPSPLANLPPRRLFMPINPAATEILRRVTEPRPVVDKKAKAAEALADLSKRPKRKPAKKKRVKK
jgi:hypothetical protein